MNKLLFACVALALVGVFSVETQAKVTDNQLINSGTFLSLVKENFEKSVNFLLTSYRYKDQSNERPGIAKIYRDQSDRRFEQGMDVLKKFVQRGGEIKQKDIFNFQTIRPELLLSTKKIAGTDYAAGFSTLKTDTEEMADAIERVQRYIITNSSNENLYDADLCHYLEEKLESEIENVVELTVLQKIQSEINGDNLANHLFDQHLLA